MTVWTGVGKLMYGWQCVQVWGNGCRYDSMYRCGETAVLMTVCTGVGKRLYVRLCTGVGKRLYRLCNFLAQC